jgi:hypothetical protein
MKLTNEQIELANQLIQSGVAKGIVSQMLKVDRATLRRNLKSLSKDNP